MMQVLLVAGRFPHASETFIYRKAVALARRGHAVTVGSRQAGDWNLYPDPLPANLRVEVWPPDSGLRSIDKAITAVARSARTFARDPSKARALLAMVRANPRTRDHARMHVVRHVPFVGRDVDIVHFEFLGLAAMYPLARELTGARIVVSCRGTETHTLSQRSAAEQQALLDVYRTADAVVCTSAELACAMTTLGGKRQNVHVSRPAVDVDAIRPVERSGRTGPLRVISTGRLVWQKGFDHLFEALARARARGVDVHAQILGDGELRSLLAFSIGDLGLAGKVELVGAVSSTEVTRRMSDADVFVLASHTEGISNAVVEAMAAGLPIVTTDAGGMTEIVTDGVEGFVVPVRDPDAIADRLAELARDEHKRLAMGAAARARAERDHSTARQSAEFDELYTALLGSAASSR